MIKMNFLSGLSTCFPVIAIFFMNSLYSQADSSRVRIQDCCMMKDGRMMHVSDGKMEVLEREMVMKNGTRCNANGECITLEGEKTMMKEGQCMDSMGRITDCSNLIRSNDNQKGKSSIIYTCPKHAEVENDGPGICPKCGTTLIERE
jgi:hypothetical protein